jgi:hypothetical protein
MWQAGIAISICPNVSDLPRNSHPESDILIYLVMSRFTDQMINLVLDGQTFRAGKPPLPILKSFPTADNQTEIFFLNAEEGFSGDIALLIDRQRPEFSEEKFKSRNGFIRDFAFNQDFD